MKKLLGLAIAMTCAGCFAQGQKARVVETPDESIGDLHCAQPRLSVSDALYYIPGVAQCEPRD